MYTRASSSNSRSHITVPAPLEKLPLFQRGGSILTRRDLVRRAAPLMWKDPITLVIALDKTGAKASGDLYMDDGDSYDYEDGKLVWRTFELTGQSKKNLLLSSKDAVSSYTGTNKAFANMAASYDRNNGFAQTIETVNVEDIVILGVASKPTCIRVKGRPDAVDFDIQEGYAYNSGSRKNGQPASVLRIKGAALPITQDWELAIDFDEAQSCHAKPSISSIAKLEDPTCPMPGQARCRNEGHIPACILISRINDGICDPECCDGSDETDGKIKCPNVCSQVNKAYRQKADEEARVARVGAKLRKDWSKSGLKDKKKIEKSIAKLTAELDALKQKEAALKVNLEKIERSEAGEIERKKNSDLYKKIEAHQLIIGNLRKNREFLQGQVDDLHLLLSDLKKSFNPNYQDMAVLGAVRAFDDWRRKNGYPIDEELPEGAGDSDKVGAQNAESHKEEVTPVEVDFEELADEELKAYEEEDILGLLDGLELSGAAQEAANILFRVEEYLPDVLRPHYDSFRSTLLDVLTNFGIISKAAIEKAERPDVVKAKQLHQDALGETKAVEDKLVKEREALSKDWGSDWAWKKLEGECIDKDLGEYTYELCWFGKATQKNNRGHGSTSLGKFSSWDPDFPQGSKESYHKQVYQGGQRCWNGPDRSVTVEITCGTSNSILTVVEPEKCTYLYKVQSPGVCTELEAAASTQSDAHPEL